MSATGREGTVHVAPWPDWSDRNPYQALFHAALEGHGVRVVSGLDAEPRAILAQRPRVDVLHLHWPYAFWRSRGGGTVRQLRAVLRFFRLLRALRAGGVRIAWTVHDLEHLEGDRLADRIGNRLLHRRADLLVHHSEWSARAARQRFGAPSGSVLVMPHGNYDGALPEPGPRAETLRRLGVPEERRVLLCFGKIRPYKGFEHAVEAMRRLPHERYHLVVAGEALPHAEALARAADRMDGVTLLSGARSPSEVADLMSAADCVLLPYLRVTTSGVLALALTHGRGVVATDLPPVREALAADPEAAVLVSEPTPEALATGIERFFAGGVERRHAAARRAGRALAWDALVGPVADWMRSAASAD